MTSSLLAGRYRVERLLGRGGMAAVYLARDERLGRLVAVKRLHSDGPEEAVRRFSREAKLGASLSHPNLVSVFDAVADHEGVLIVMEYVPGTTLGRELAAGPLRPKRAINVISGVAGGLDHAHEHGIVHRDVKPSNVLLGEHGAVKLADLGIATAVEHTRITRSGAVLGTPAYMAPEQLEGGRTSPASDRYSLAAMAFEVLTGRKPRTGSTPVALAYAIATSPPPDLRDAWPQAPADAAEVLKRGMAPERSERYSSAREMADELAAALEQAEDAPETELSPTVERPEPPRFPAVPPSARPSRPAPAPPSHPAPAAARVPQPAPRPRRRVSALLPLLLLAAALLVAGIIVLSSSGGGNESASVRAGSGKPRTTTSAGKNPKPSAPPPTTAPSPGAPSAAAPSPTSTPGDGARLNDEGFRLMRAGRYAEAVPVLRRAVASFPSGTTDLQYAYALFNLGRSLRLTGHAAEAIPILERRLRIPNQTAAVQSELAAARRAAGRG